MASLGLSAFDAPQAPSRECGARRPPPAVEIASGLEGLASLRDDYERLHRRTGNTLPFSLHEWHTAWCAHFLHDTPEIHDQLLIFVLRDAAGACVGLLPQVLTRRRVGPFTTRTIDALGADPGLTEIRAPLIEPGYESAAAHALQRHLEGRRTWDWMCWRGLGMSFGAALAESPARLKWQPPLVDYVLDLPSSWEGLRARLKRNIRESLRHCHNSLKRDGLVATLHVAATPAAVRDALDRFLVLHAMRADMASTVAHPDKFAGSAVRRFLYDVCERLAARGAVRVFQLVVGDEIVAARIGFVVNDSLYLYYSGFDPRWRRYSVMTTAMAGAIRYAISCGLASVNLSPGTDVGKTRWGPRAVYYGEAVQVSPSLNAHVSRALYERARLNGGAGMATLARLYRRSQRDWGAR